MAKAATPALHDALAARGLDAAVGGESRVPLAAIGDHVVSWAQYFADSPVPGVLRTKWFERRHVLHQTRRWHRDHLAELHMAWLNGTGMLLWENVFGAWVGWHARDRALMRAMRSVQRSHGAWLRSEAWTPLADPPSSNAHMFGSRWDHDGCSLWTVANRGSAMEGPWLLTEERPGWTWTELTTGRRLEPQSGASGRVAVGGQIDAGGVAAVFVAPGAPRIVLRSAETPTPNDTTFPLRIAIRAPAPTKVHAAVPTGTAGVPGWSGELEVRYRVRETGLYGEAPFVDAWKPPLGVQLHRDAVAHRAIALAPFAIDVREVTNAAYAAFVTATGYTPARGTRFLAHWRDGRPMATDVERPVANVDLDDDRAFAAWRGARLPTEDEWQHAAQLGHLERGTPRVWNLTESEHDDGRTRFVIVKGGSDHVDPRPEWPFDGGPRPPSFSAKLLRLAGGLERSPWVGFRCAVHLAIAAPASLAPGSERDDHQERLVTSASPAPRHSGG